MPAAAARIRSPPWAWLGFSAADRSPRDGEQDGQDQRNDPGLAQGVVLEAEEAPDALAAALLAFLDESR